MKVLVVTTKQPFVHGGAEELARHLVARLHGQGHEAEALALPFSWEPAERLVEEMLIARTLRLFNVDRVIALKFPAYLIEHRDKRLWLLHQFRQAYDLFDAGQTHIGRDAAGDELRAAIRTADEAAFAEATRFFALPGAARRVRRYHGLEAIPLATPLNDPELFSGGDAEGYILAAGRVGAAKRQELLIRALAHAPSARLWIAGPPETEDLEGRWRLLAEELGVADRLRLELRFLARGELAERVNRCLASAYIPLDEDNYGYVTLEAFSARKPVITTTDSGAVLDIVRDGENGYVVEPSPAALGSAFRRISEDPARAVLMGRAGRETLRRLALSWGDVIERLMS